MAATMGVVALPNAAHAQPDVAQSVVVSQVPAAFTPKILDGTVSAIAVVGTTTVVGGTFTQAQPAAGGVVEVHSYLLAFDSTTGAIQETFAPVLDGEVQSLDVVGTSVVVGGQFTHVNGVARRGIVRLNVTDGSTVSTFIGKLDNGQVNSVVVRGNLVYLAGRFTAVNGVARGGLAVLDATTGALGALNLPVGASRNQSVGASVTRIALSPDGATLVVGGNFQTIAGLARNQLALVNTATSTVSTWATSRFEAMCSTSDYTDINDIGYSPDGRYFVLATTGGPFPGTLCDSATRWDSGRTGAGQEPTWVDSTGGDTLTAVAVTGSAVYLGGHQRWFNNSSGHNSAGAGAISRVGIGALDPVSGVPLAWDPTLQRNEGVGDLLATSTGLWIGYDANLVGGLNRPRIAFLPAEGGQTILAIKPNQLPGSLVVAGTDGSLTTRNYNGVTFGTSAPVVDKGSVLWGQVSGAFAAGNRVFYATSNGHLWTASFNGVSVGTPVDTGSWFDFTGVQGMTLDNGRLYYVTGDGALYYRMFSPSSMIVGSERFTAAATSYAGIRALFVANGQLYFVKTATHTLWRILLAGGVPSGTAQQASGPGVDALVWGAAASFLVSGDAPPVIRPPGHVLVAPPATGGTVGPHRPVVR